MDFSRLLNHMPKERSAQACEIQPELLGPEKTAPHISSTKQELDKHVLMRLNEKNARVHTDDLPTEYIR